jgi:3-hydroxy-9,10-secoandrosta-1,3,5(10)-triene-9,17-dione monooxygenase reductase component
VTIHASDPFATPEESRSPVRRLRGRLPAAVTLWTVYGEQDRPAGLTVSSTVVIEGEPARLLGVLDEESDLFAALRAGGPFAVTALTGPDRRLADAFAAAMPVPGGPFTLVSWDRTGYGPVPAGAATWAGCRLDNTRPIGWGQLVEATIERVELASAPTEPLVTWRGRYRTP